MPMSETRASGRQSPSTSRADAAPSAVGPGRRALRLPEPVEDVRQEGGLDPLTGVAHGDLDVRVDALEAELDAPVPRGELDGVREQVPEDLLETLRIAGDDDRAGVD